MSKYPFFAKTGRPSSYEQGICKKINKLLNEGQVNQGDINRYKKENGGNLPTNTDELEYFYNFITGEQPIEKEIFNDSSEEQEMDDDFDMSEELDIDPSMESLEEEAFDFNKSNPDAVSFSPFSAPVIEREYTKGVPPSSQTTEEQVSQETSSEASTEANQVFDEEDFKEPEIEEDIPEPSWSNTVEEEELLDENNNFDDAISEKEKLGGNNLEDLSPQQKRKSAEKTADAIIQMYGKFIPIPFIKMASFNETKIQKMAYEGKIDMNMPLENNVTVRQFIEGTNEQVKEIFTVTEEEKAELKDPLVDVLMEQELAFTPFQRLMLAFGGQMVTKGFSAFQLMQNNKVALEAFERYHQEMRGTSRPQPSAPNRPSQASSVKFTENKPKEEFSDFDKENIKSFLQDLDNDVIDPDNDPNVEVDESFDDN